MEQFVLLLIIAAISLVNWILQKSAEHREKRKAEAARGESFQPDTPEPEDRRETQFNPMDQTRKFLEALGLPDDALPPRPVEAPPALPPMGNAPAWRSEESAPKRDFLHKLHPDLEQRLYPEPKFSPAPPTRIRAPRSTAATVTVSASSSARGLVTGLLTEKEGMRRAVVMREILGPPRAFQPW
jgi:hypothetical protein